jgi:signal transduction histidine kinase
MKKEPQTRKVYWSLILIFIYFSLAAAMAGYAFFLNEKKNINREKWSQLDAILDLKGKQIADWLKERKADGTAILEDPFVASRIQRFLQNPNETGSRQDLLDWMKSLQRVEQDQNYKRVVLLDSELTGRLSVPQGQTVLDPVPKKVALQAAQGKNVILSDLFQDGISNSIRLGLSVPILARNEKNPRTVGIVYLEIDPGKDLYPLVQSWPTPSRTSEALLVGREGEQGTFLSELRYRKDAALSLHFSVNDKHLIAARAVRGEEGVAEGLDYRGVPVIGAIAAVPDSPWVLVAKVDQQEIYAPIRTQAKLMAVFSAGFIIMIAFAVGFIWRGQHLEEHRFFEEEIQELNNQLERFSYFIAGDLRTSTIGVEGLSRMVLEKSSARLDDRARELLGLIRQESQNMLHLISDLMTFSRMEDSEMSLSRIDMAELARTVLDELKAAMPATEELNVDVKASCSPCGDRSMIRKVFYNLLSNAIKLREPGEKGVIEIGCKTDIDEDIFYVKGSRPKTESQEGACVIEPFPGDKPEQAEIELAIVRRIVQRHGGRVWAEGGVNDGATFYFTLPKREPCQV